MKGKNNQNLPVKLTFRKYFSKSAPLVGRIASHSPDEPRQRSLCISLYSHDWNIPMKLIKYWIWKMRSSQHTTRQTREKKTKCVCNICKDWHSAPFKSKTPRRWKDISKQRCNKKYVHIFQFRCIHSLCEMLHMCYKKFIKLGNNPKQHNIMSIFFPALWLWLCNITDSFRHTEN